MCLIVVLFQQRFDATLIVAANRDEHLSRAAEPMAVLRPASPPVLGGRDLLHGGTWLAVSEHGVVAALTNTPSSGGRDPKKRSRGELPLYLATQRSAVEAAEALSREIHPADYNPCWLIVGDREALFYIELGANEPLRPESLPPGIYALENRPLRPVSAKAAFVRTAVEASLPPVQAPLGSLVEPLRKVLSSHTLPVPASDFEPAEPPQFAGTQSACVHVGDVYGTRSASIVMVETAIKTRPRFLFSRGPLCRAELEDAGPLWTGAAD